jgi:hypothetical protein
MNDLNISRLAMERLKKKDLDAGVQAERPLTDDQRAAIAEAKKVSEARIAEREILYHCLYRSARDPKRPGPWRQYRRDRERITPRPRPEGRGDPQGLRRGARYRWNARQLEKELLGDAFGITRG